MRKQNGVKNFITVIALFALRSFAMRRRRIMPNTDDREMIFIYLPNLIA